jgi:septation ring formation regulator EzrA
MNYWSRIMEIESNPIIMFVVFLLVVYLFATESKLNKLEKKIEKHIEKLEKWKKEIENER